MTRRALVLLLALCAAPSCKKWAEISEEQGELRDELMAMAKNYRSQMCRCPDEACAGKLDVRFQAWIAQMRHDIVESDQRNGTTAKISDEWDTAFKAVVDGYDTCRIKIAIHRN